MNTMYIFGEIPCINTSDFVGPQLWTTGLTTSFSIYKYNDVSPIDVRLTLWSKVIGRVKVTVTKETEMSSNSDSSLENDACKELSPIPKGRRKKRW